MTAKDSPERGCEHDRWEMLVVDSQDAPHEWISHYPPPAPGALLVAMEGSLVIAPGPYYRVVSVRWFATWCEHCDGIVPHPEVVVRPISESEFDEGTS